jgi:hypothetical protein
VGRRKLVIDSEEEEEELEEEEVDLVSAKRERQESDVEEHQTPEAKSVVRRRLLKKKTKKEEKFSFELTTEASRLIELEKNRTTFESLVLDETLKSFLQGSGVGRSEVGKFPHRIVIAREDSAVQSNQLLQQRYLQFKKGDLIGIGHFTEGFSVGHLLNSKKNAAPVWGVFPSRQTAPVVDWNESALERGRAAYSEAHQEKLFSVKRKFRRQMERKELLQVTHSFYLQQHQEKVQESSESLSPAKLKIRRIEEEEEEVEEFEEEEEEEEEDAGNGKGNTTADYNRRKEYQRELNKLLGGLGVYITIDHTNEINVPTRLHYSPAEFATEFRKHYRPGARRYKVVRKTNEVLRKRLNDGWTGRRGWNGK